MSHTARTGQILLRDQTTLTLVSGVVTRTQDYHIIAAETGTTDDLDTITLDATITYSVNSINYRPSLLIIADAGDTITLKHGTGNLDLPNDADINLTDDAYLWLFYNGTNWRVFAGANVSGLANPVDLIQWNTAYSPGAHSTGNMYWDSVNGTVSVDLAGSDVILQMGQEIHVYVLNNSGGDIDNGEVVYVTGVSGGLLTVDLAQANAAATSTVLGVATEDILNTANGYITIMGVVRDFNTSAFSPNDMVYLSATTPGALTATKPNEPNFQRRIGEVLTSDIATGSIRVDIQNEITLFDLSDNTQDILALANGATLDTPATAVTSDGATITLTVDNDVTPGADIVVKFSTGIYYWSMTDSVTLTAGSDTVPVLSYVYFLESTKTLTASTAGWPAAEHAPIATVYCQSAASLQTDGAYKVHVWTDHTVDADGQGHLADLNYWIRQQNATWQSGVAATFSGSGTGTIGLATTSGVVLQLHPHAFPAFTDPATIYVVNHATTKFKEITNIGSGILVDSAGGSLTNKYYALVFWGCVSQDSADCKIYCNVPAGSYNSFAAARTDASGYNNFSIPSEFKGTGFLIYRLLIRNNSGTSWTLDTGGAGDILLGTIPGTSAGSSSTVATNFSDAQFTVFNNTDNTKIMALSVSGVTTATTRTLTVPDANGTIALTSQLLADPVPIANGGTGQTAKTAAFDALSPVTTAGDIIYRNASNNVRLAIGTATQVLTVNAGATAPEWADAAGGGGLYTSIAILEDQKATTTAGGATSNTAWTQRAINTEVSDPDSIVTISSNQFTPIAGTYHISAIASIYRSDAHRLRLYNVTGAATVKQGPNGYAQSNATYPSGGYGFVECVFTANGTDAYRLDHYTVNGNASGLGVAASDGTNEVYCTIRLEKLA